MTNEKLSTEKTMEFVFVLTIIFSSLLFSCWYEFKMSGIGENPSDPARAESRKRKECPDQLGPRFVGMFCRMWRIETFY